MNEADKGKIIIVPNMMVKVAAIASKVLYQREVVLGIAAPVKSKIER